MMLSIEIKETKQCTILLVLSFEIEKVNGWIFLNFQPKVIISIFTGVKLQIFCQTNNVYTTVIIKPSQMEVAPIHRTFVISHKRRLFMNTKGI